MDEVPLDREPERPPPRHATLALLVGRVTTIKLAYWATLTVSELLIPRFLGAGVDDRLPISYAVTAAGTLLALAWARSSARATDRRSGRIERSIPTIATTFAAASVVASPASLPLLIIERQRSIEGCAAALTCHIAPLWLWGAMLAVGLVLIPAAFAASLRRTYG